MTTFEPIIRREYAHVINGVDGRMFGATVRPRDLEHGTFCKQRWGASRPAADGCTLSVELRFDDDCSNGHNTFAMTGTLRDPRVKRDGGFVAGGCLHDEIARYFPELAPLIKWHLTSTDGPMHYLANTIYLAKARELDKARAAAVWPDATDEDLTAPGLKERLEARLPALMAEFRAAMVDTCGFLWSPTDC